MPNTPQPSMVSEGDLLHAIAVATAGEPDLERILAGALEQLHRAVAFTGGSIALVEDDELVIRAAVGPFAETARGLRQKRGNTLSWGVVTSGRPFLSHDLLADGYHPSSAFRSFLAVPLVWRGAVFGMLEIDSVEPNAFTEQHLALLQKVAMALSGSVELARRYAAEAAALAMAEQAIRERDSFITIASHELRTPLTIVLGHAQMLLRNTSDGGTLGEQERRSLQHIVMQSVRLNRMVAALLDISRLQGGQMQLDLHPLDLVALVRLVVGEMQPLLTDHELTLDAPEGELSVLGDSLRLTQVFHNLIGNAIKYSPRGGPIAVTVERDGQRACVSIRDEGLGIPAEALAHLHERFYRAANVRAQQIAGMGIGLHLVYELVLLHSGAMRVESQEGRGSIFTVELPLYTGEPSLSDGETDV
ncbi:MAG TPA: ATP-binding protein [Roseiflexaceae bacterium]|nr:ATP-binding protein [Roseiflexaceae bacterium]